MHYTCHPILCCNSIYCVLQLFPLLPCILGKRKCIIGDGVFAFKRLMAWHLIHVRRLLFVRDYVVLWPEQGR